MAEKKPAGNNSRIIILIVFILAVIAFTGFIGYFINIDRGLPNGEVPEHFVSYPTVKASLASSKDGTSHSIDVDFVIEYKVGEENNAEITAVHKKMQDTVSRLDYERLRADDSIDHLEAVIREGISEITGEDTVQNVYVGNILIDFPNVIDAPAQSNRQNFEGRLRGLFKNMR